MARAGTLASVLSLTQHRMSLLPGSRSTPTTSPAGPTSRAASIATSPISRAEFQQTLTGLNARVEECLFGREQGARSAESPVRVRHRYSPAIIRVTSSRLKIENGMV